MDTSFHYGKSALSLVYCVYWETGHVFLDEDSDRDVANLPVTFL